MKKMFCKALAMTLALGFISISTLQAKAIVGSTTENQTIAERTKKKKAPPPPKTNININLPNIHIF